jgi:uncharacterized protein YaiI (UPF0178 family)
MQIFVDADACPVKNIIVRVARENNLPVTMIIDSSHELGDQYSTVITVEKAKDSVDLALINLVKAGDIVVTQDYGLAALVLGKSAKAINQNGLVFSNENIDQLLMDRHVGQKIRRGGGRTKGPSKRTRQDDEQFEKAFQQIIK